MVKDSLGLEFPVDNVSVARQFAWNSNVGRSGFFQNQLLGCAGIVIPWPGYGIAWAMLSRTAKFHKVFIHRSVLTTLDHFIHARQLRRVEANVDAHQATAMQWVERLGFKFESSMPNYGPKGELFYKYVILH